MVRSKSKKIIIFDWDDTLFETSKFIKNIKCDFSRRFKISEEDFTKAYQKSYDEKKCWQLEKFARELKKIIPGIKQKMILTEWNAWLTQAKKFVYPDVRPFFDKLEKRGDTKKILISFGQKKFQWQKIENSGLKFFFDKIIIDSTDVAKEKIITRIFKNREPGVEVFFVEDKGSGVEVVKKNNPGINSVWIKRASGRYLWQKCQADFTIKNLRELEKVTR